MNDPLPCPSLYIYSVHDLLTDPQKVDELVEERQRTHSSKIFSLKILDSEEKSPHVMHFLKHPDRYSRSLHDFIKYAVSRTRWYQIFIMILWCTDVLWHLTRNWNSVLIYIYTRSSQSSTNSNILNSSILNPRSLESHLHMTRLWDKQSRSFVRKKRAWPC